jgi:hypothetical protein
MILCFMSCSYTCVLGTVNIFQLLLMRTELPRLIHLLFIIVTTEAEVIWGYYSICYVSYFSY